MAEEAGITYDFSAGLALRADEMEAEELVFVHAAEMFGVAELEAE